jgi:hypothetical protein
VDGLVDVNGVDDADLDLGLDIYHVLSYVVDYMLCRCIFLMNLGRYLLLRLALWSGCGSHLFLIWDVEGAYEWLCWRLWLSRSSVISAQL